MSFVQRYGPGVLSSLVGQLAPLVARGALVELLKRQGITAAAISQWVQENRSLWKQMGPEDREKLRKMIARVKDVSWITSEWAIDAVRKDMPGIASLFLGWPKARHWLDRQIEELRKGLTS